MGNIRDESKIKNKKQIVVKKKNYLKTFPRSEW